MAAQKVPKPILSQAGQKALEAYEYYLRHQVDLRPVTVRNYLGDVRLFIAWCERTWSNGAEEPQTFSAERVTTPTLTRYRDYLQHDLGRQPTTINRYLVSLKSYFRWATDSQTLSRDPARAVKLVPQVTASPRHLSDQEESDFVAAVQAGDNLRDYALVVVMLHTGLRVGEVCQLKWEDVVMGPRSGRLRIWGKRNKYREVPLNATVRQTLRDYEATLSSKQGYLFLSLRTGDKLTPRAIRFITAKYARQAGVSSLRVHDLRHRFGYRMAERVPLHRLAQIMGHDSLDTTMRYIQGTQRDLQQAVETIAWE
jgi:integrase/recombinase XerC